MKKSHFKSSHGTALLRCVTAGLFLSGGLFRLAAADDGTQPAAATVDTASDPNAAVAPDSAAVPDMTTDPAMVSGSMDADSPTPVGAAPSPTPAAASPEIDNDETSVKPAPKSGYTSPLTPDVDVEAPLPQSSDNSNTNMVADAVPLPASPPLRQQFSDYDVTGIESPLFTKEAINDFAERPLYLTGNWSLKFHLGLDTIYDGNIFLRSNHVQGDLITRVSPGVTMRLGNTDSIFYLVADYTVGLNFYMQHPNESTVDQDFATSLQWNLTKTTITVRGGVFDDSGQDVDVTDLVQRQLYEGGVAVHYEYSDKTSFDLSGDYSRSDFNGLISSSQVEGQAFVNYDYSPRTQVGVGATFGYLEVPGGSDQTFEQANVRATDRVTGKLTVIAQAGSEFRQYSDGGGATVTPVFSLEGAWQVREGTEVDLTIQRQIYASAILQDQDYTSTETDLTVSQRIGDNVSVSLTGGYVNVDYTATAANVDATREDNYFYIRPSVEWKALSWLSVGVFYEYDQDLSSGDSGNSFTRDRGGVDIAILF